MEAWSTTLPILLTVTLAAYNAGRAVMPNNRYRPLNVGVAVMAALLVILRANQLG